MLTTPMRILVVEDETKTAAYLCKGLTENGFVVDVAHNGGDGEHLAQTQDYDLILLDVMLPGSDGWTILKSLRRTKQTPVLFLTAKGTVDDRVKGLELGADDAIRRLRAKVDDPFERKLIHNVRGVGYVLEERQ